MDAPPHTSGQQTTIFVAKTLPIKVNVPYGDIVPMSNDTVTATTSAANSTKGEVVVTGITPEKSTTVKVYNA